MNLEQNFRDLRVHKWYNRVLWLLATHILFLFNKICFGLQIESNQNVRELKTGYLSICNHVHYLDCSMVVNALSNRRCFFPTLEENTHIPVIGHLVSALGGWAIPRNTSGLKHFSQLVEQALYTNYSVHIFPEGELKPYATQLRPMKKGAFTFAAKSQVPIVPLVITYRKPNRARKLFNKKPLLKITVLDPVYPPKGVTLKESINILYQTCQRKMLAQIQIEHQ